MHTFPRGWTLIDRNTKAGLSSGVVVSEFFGAVRSMKAEKFPACMLPSWADTSKNEVQSLGIYD